VSELDEARGAFEQADARAQELAVMGSHELYAAVAAVRRAADGLLAYHQNLWAANQPRAAAWDRLRKLGGQVPEPFTYVTPDYGPFPMPEDGATVVTGKPAVWHRLLGSLNAHNVDEVARALGELNGWEPASQPGTDRA
jgi:hypothetical protein